jgi:hypothetical protein
MSQVCITKHRWTLQFRDLGFRVLKTAARTRVEVIPRADDKLRWLLCRLECHELCNCTLIVAALAAPVSDLREGRWQFQRAMDRKITD